MRQALLRGFSYHLFQLKKEPTLDRLLHKNLSFITYKKTGSSHLNTLWIEYAIL